MSVLQFKSNSKKRKLVLYVFVQHTAVQTTKGFHPRAIRRVRPGGTSESRGAGGALPSGGAHQEPSGQVQVHKLGYSEYALLMFSFIII